MKACCEDLARHQLTLSSMLCVEINKYVYIQRVLQYQNLKQGPNVIVSHGHNNFANKLAKS